jgi:hypothetical protein
MRGAVAVSADLGGVDILSGAEALSLYKFNTGRAKHFFARNAASTPITNGDPILINTGSMLLACQV